MKKLRLLAAGILLPLLTIAQTKPNTTFTLRTQIANADKNTQIFLAYQFDGKKIIDSANQKNGWYTFSGSIERPLNATLVADHEGAGSPALMKRRGNLDAIKIYIHPGTIELKTDKLSGNPTFTGSAINTDNEHLKAMLKPIMDQLTNLSNQLRAGNFIISASEMKTPRPRQSASDSLKVSRIIKQMDSLGSATRPIMKQFILENPNSYIALLQLQSYGGSFPDVKLIEPMYNRLSASVRNTVEGKAYAKVLSDRKNLVVGTKAPDFTQNDTEGKPVSLSSFKGKYVLLDFWASWCGPCRKENPELVKIFNDFKDRNFTILGISLDDVEGKSAWLKAIKDDQLNWTQVSDLKHWDNDVAKLYSIRAIPQSFLIGLDGTIIAKSPDNKALRKKLEEIFVK